MAKIQITSPVRPITSGKAPTKDTLAKGQIAVGAVSGEQCIYINPDGTQVVDALKDVKAKITSEKNTTAAAIDSLNSKVNAINNSKGAANGIATLDDSGKVPSAQLPSYVDDVLEFANKNAFPSPGESGKIYIAIDTNKSYRWGGTAYTEISKSLALGETASTAYAGSKGKANADAIAAIKRDKYVKPTGWEIDSTGNNFAKGEVSEDGGEGGTAQIGDGVNIRCEKGEAIVDSAVGSAKTTVLTIPNATASKNGMMSASDKEYLDKVKSGSSLKLSIGRTMSNGIYIDYGLTIGGTEFPDDSFLIPTATDWEPGLMDSGMYNKLNHGSLISTAQETILNFFEHNSILIGTPSVSWVETGLLLRFQKRILKEDGSYEDGSFDFEIPYSDYDGESGLLSNDQYIKLCAIPAPETIVTEVELVVETI